MGERRHLHQCDDVGMGWALLGWGNWTRLTCSSLEVIVANSSFDFGRRLATSPKSPLTLHAPDLLPEKFLVPVLHEAEPRSMHPRQRGNPFIFISSDISLDTLSLASIEASLSSPC